MSDLLNPANLIVLAVIAVGMFFGLRCIVASTHGKSCCSDGASGKKAKKVVVVDTDASHYPYSDELLIGVAMGFSMRLVFSAIDLAGVLVSNQMGLGFATAYDPQSAANTAVVSEFLGMLALLGGANSIQFTCMNTLTLIDLPNADASSGNSLLSTIMQLSIAVSIAAASLLLDSFGGHSATSGKAVETAFHTTFATIGAIAAASSFIFALVDKDKGITRKRKKAA